MDLAAGQTIGDYEVLGTLGAGGMGKVYKVRSIVSQRIEAMKILLPDLSAQPELSERFLREIRISAGLEHPNIASLRTAQQIGNQLLMVMEYVDGPTLSDLMHRERLPLERSLQYVTQALSALDYAHSHGVIHRDIKPGNIMITAAGQVKLMDFGIARLTTDTKLTKTGLMVGSVHYMSPEQIEGKDLDVRSDIYSLGVTFYELVTGKRPFDGESEYQIMAAHLKGAPQPPLEIDHSLPPLVNDVILTALARNLTDRFASAKAMQNAVTTLLQNVSAPAPIRSAAQPGPTPPRTNPRRQRVLYMTAGSLATLALLVGAAIEIPNFRHTQANNRPVAGQSSPADHNQQAQPVVPAPPISATTNVPAQPTVALPSPQQATPVDLKPDRPVVHPVEPAATRAKRPRESVAHLQSTASSAIQTPAPTTEPPVTQPPQSPPANPVAPVDDSAELSALGERMMLLGARVSAVRNSLQNLREAQAQSGLGLRSDMAAAEQRLLVFMGGAEESLKNNDAASARKRLDSAEAELDKLETFFGK